MIISLHIPKTAGSSFRKALQEAYPDGFLLDYHHQQRFDDLLNKGNSLDTIHRDWLKYSKYVAIARYFIRSPLPENIKVIHGHFPANKYYDYLKFRKAMYITWVRDPFNRMVSNYYFWKSIKDETPDLFVRKIFQENWTLEKYCFCPIFKNYQSLYMRGFNVKNFTFIGVVEFYQEELEFLGKNILQKKLNVYYENKTKTINNEMETVLQDSTLKKKFMEFHKEDYELYKYALAKERDRKQTFISIG